MGSAFDNGHDRITSQSTRPGTLSVVEAKFEARRVIFSFGVMRMLICKKSAADSLDKRLQSL